ncbi:MAG: DUF3810 domain-containing protein [Saprospiraceae bacterium]
MEKRYFLKNKKKWIWVALGLLAILVRVLLGFSPELTERLYSRGIFVGIRCLLDYTIGWLPIPFVQVFLVGLIIFIISKVRNLIRTHTSFIESLKRVSLGIVSFCFGVIFFFLVLWGYNYGRLPVENSMNLTPNPLTLTELKTELGINTKEVSDARLTIPNITDSAIQKTFLPIDLENEVRQEVEKLLEKLDYPTAGTVRGRLLQPKGILLRFSTAGVYFPWTGESNIDAGLHPIQIPFTLAHEFAHGYGFTDEGTCNFLAYLACIQSENPVFQYSGHLSYWRYLASSYRRNDREGYTEYFKTLPKGMITDLYSIDANSDKYPDILPQWRNAVYDTYLKTQGIPEGVINYNRIVMLVKSWREKK